ncbi:mgpp2cl-1, protein phosphatase 2C-like protein 1 [Tilletia horrida]|nr:mgpp2cl-1, protein phosphatase 2C-like protein 1 [Tilletia horrida]
MAAAAASAPTQLPILHHHPTADSGPPDEKSDYIPPMYIKEIDDPDGYKRPDSGYQPWWYERIPHHGSSPYHPTDPSSYPIFRNVRDYGAVGDGSSLDDDAIEQAMTDGGRCGHNCGTSTTQNAVIYFPPGTYLLSRPIQSYYGTSVVGDPNWRPVLKAAAGFQGIALLDEDPYDDKGQLWWINQVNFFRQTRNIVFDLREQADGLTGTGIHRPTSQATALSNCHFELSRSNPNTTQQGVLMEAGSGGNMGNLTFRGGQYGLAIGNQQFTVTDLRFEGQSKAAINVFWSWVLTFQNVEVRDTPVAVLAPTNASSTVDQRGSGQQAASIVMVDWRLQDVAHALSISAPQSGVFVLENIRALRTPIIVASGAGAAASPSSNTNGTGTDPSPSLQDQQVNLRGDARGWTVVPAWMQGGAVEGDRAGRWHQGAIEPARRPGIMRSLAHSDGRWFTHADVKPSDVIDVKRHGGVQGDGVTDDTEALQRILDRARSRPDALVFIPHGVYVVTSTLNIHPNTRIVGEAYSVLLGAGEYFNDIDNPRVVFRFGRPPKHCGPQRRAESPQQRNATVAARRWDGLGDQESDSDDDGDEDEDEDEEEEGGEERYGRVEVSDLIFSTRGPAAGAIVVEWNLRGAHPRHASDPAWQGAVGMWDAHVRLGGFRGSNLEGDTCPRDGLGSRTAADAAPCRAAFLGLHLTRHASAYLSGTWVWLADHDLDRRDEEATGAQISLYSGRGVLVENRRGGPVWMYGVGSEHHLLVNFNLYHARNVYMSIPQTETAYFQGTGWPCASETQPPSHTYHDPLFRTPSAPTLNGSFADPAYDRGLGLRMRGCRDVVVYGAGLYSFFDNDTACNAKNGACQRSLVSLEHIRNSPSSRDANVVLYALNTVGTDSMLDLDHARVVPTAFWRNGFTASLGRWRAGGEGK